MILFEQLMNFVKKSQMLYTQKPSATIYRITFTIEKFIVDINLLFKSNPRLSIQVKLGNL